MLAVLLEVVTALIALCEGIALIAGALAILDLIFDPKGKQRVGYLLANIVGGGMEVAVPLVAALETALGDVAAAYINSFEKQGPALADTIGTAIGPIAGKVFTDTAGDLKAGGLSTVANSLKNATLAMEKAYSFGFSSAAVTALFEAIFPEKLNVLNGVGPMLATMSGFGEISSTVREPLYEAAFGRSLRYLMNNTFKPELPREQDAVEWHARRFLSDPELQKVFEVSGLKTEYEAAYVQSAYRPVSPFIVERAATTGVLDHNELLQLFQFYGMRDQDIAVMEKAFNALAAEPYRQQAIRAAVKAAERGNITGTDLGAAFAALEVSNEQSHWLNIEIAYTRMEQLAELYRKSVDVAYKAGLIADADYVPHLEAIGIGNADADAHYAIVSFEKQGKVLAAQERAAAKLSAEIQRAAVRAAVETYLTS